MAVVRLDPNSALSRHVSGHLPNQIGTPSVPDGPMPGKTAGMRLLRPEVRAESAPARKQAAAMIEIDRVSQVFQTTGRKSHLALSEISLSIEDGAFCSILGPSGRDKC